MRSFFLVGLAVALGLQYWAYRALTDRSGKVGLYLLFGFPGILLFVAGVATTIFGKDIGPALLFPGLGFTLPLVPSFRKRLAQVTPIDPASPIDLSALAIVLAIMAFLAVATWTAPDPDSIDAAISKGQLVLQMFFWILLAYVCVGFKIRRNFAESNSRLGLLRPKLNLTTLGIALGFLVLALIVNAIGSTLTAVFQPGYNDAIQKGLEELTGKIQNPAGAILIGVGAGVGEEIFFRGALQPKFGIILTSLCFALLHTNYGLSFVTLGVFSMGIVFGIQRNRFGTVSAMITHGLIDVVAVLAQTHK